MVRSKGKHKILTQGEVEDIKFHKHEAEQALKQAGDYGAGTRADGIDKAKLQGQVKYFEKVLEDGKAPTVRGAGKDKLAAESKALEGIIKEGLPTRFEMDHPAKAPGAIHKHMNWAKRNKQNIARFKEINRTLTPEDPTAVDIERFRKEK